MQAGRSIECSPINIHYIQASPLEDPLMHRFDMRIILTASAAAVWFSAAALGGDSLPVTITNDNSDSILVTAYDLNVRPRAAILVGVKISGFASIPLSITPGPDGYGHIVWSATSADSFSRQCGHRDRARISNNAVIHVHANSECRSPQQ